MKSTIDVVEYPSVEFHKLIAGDEKYLLKYIIKKNKLPMYFKVKRRGTFCVSYQLPDASGNYSVIGKYYVYKIKPTIPLI